MTPAQAQAQLDALSERLAAEYPKTTADVSLTLVPVEERLVGGVRMALLVARGSVGCLLLIACANVTSLTLPRLAARSQEIAVRAAIGAGRWRIARQLVTETLVMAARGGALGLLLARWGLAALPGLIGDRVPRVDEVSLSTPVLLFSIGAIAAVGLLVAVVPIFQLSMTRLEGALRAGFRGGETRSGTRLRAALVVSQIALAVMVLSGALLLSRSLVRLLNVDAGFNPERLLTLHLLLIDPPTPGPVRRSPREGSSRSGRSQA